MKTLIVSSLLAAFVAFALTSLKFEQAVSLLVSAGLFATMFADYTRQYRPLSISSPNRATAGKAERLVLAA